MYLYILVFYGLVTFIPWILRSVNWTNFTKTLFNRRIFNTNGLFKNNFIDSHVLYTAKFNALPNINLIQHIDTTKAYALILENFADEITAVHQYNTFDHNDHKTLFNVTIFVLRKKRMVELGYDYAEIFYTGKNYNWAETLLSELAKFRVIDRIKVMGFANSEVMN